MTTNVNLIHVIADALIEAHGQDATEWLECEGRAAIERAVAGWHAAIGENAWIDRPEDVLVLRALRHVEHGVELAGGARIKARICALVDEDWHGRRRYAKSRIGDVFAHELLLGDTGEPFESIEYAFREHGEAVRGDDDSSVEAAPPPPRRTRVECASPRAQFVERRIRPRLLAVRQGSDGGRGRRARVSADDDRVPVRAVVREEGDRMVRRLEASHRHLVELVCPPNPPSCSPRGLRAPGIGPTRRHARVTAGGASAHRSTRLKRWRRFDECTHSRCGPLWQLRGSREPAALSGGASVMAGRLPVLPAALPCDRERVPPAGIGVHADIATSVRVRPLARRDLPMRFGPAPAVVRRLWRCG